jgi:hypothetical protein
MCSRIDEVEIGVQKFLGVLIIVIRVGGCWRASGESIFHFEGLGAYMVWLEVEKANPCDPAKQWGVGYVVRFSNHFSER